MVPSTPLRVNHLLGSRTGDHPGRPSEQQDLGVESLEPERGFRVSVRLSIAGEYAEIIVELVDASISPRYEEQAAFLLEGLRPSTGMAGVLNVKTLVTRLRELKSSPARRATRKQDQAALDLLAER